MLQKTTNNIVLSFKFLGSIIIFLIYFLLSLSTSDPFNMAVLFAFGMMTPLVIGFWITFFVAKFFKKKHTSLIKKIKQFKHTKLTINILVFIEQEALFVFVSLFAAIGLASILFQATPQNISFVYALSYFILTIWAKIITTLGKKAIFVNLFCTIFIIPLIPINLFPLKENAIFFFIALAMAPLIQEIIFNFKEDILSKYF
ncbi:MAG: hypothetical protein PHX27_03880 [Candidatus ainarchaeum sp.]|nr:hypothetical protein [Candidatus ainarchaeum sp.]